MKRQIKTYINSILLILVTLFSACLKKDLPEYPSFDGTNIDNVYLEYRYNTSMLYNGQPVVGYQRLTVTKTVDEANNKINLTVTVPAASGTFTSAERDKVVLTNLWMYFDISTAATVSPAGGSPKLGDPANMALPQQYTVTAANGKVRMWTITITNFTK